ncbi:MAG: hypothetical protein DMG65_14490 [Candidatus Angelobacter sp. Gp1-AA117]|nr:MAG: hypothetical protein DMG65_14490 [Candidatus Angelobacter sp. Gp1-AA117]
MSFNQSGHLEIGSSGHRKTGEYCRVPRFLALINIFLLLAISTTNSQNSQAKDNSFTEQTASKLLNQVAEGLNGRTVKKMLSAFDLTRMNGGVAFKDQISAFFNQTDSIRVHFKLLEVTDNVTVVDAEMDITPHSDLAPPQHKYVQLRFIAENGPHGWKFTDVQPRNFFSQSS